MPASTIRVRGHRDAGKYLATGLIEAGIDVGYAYKPLHHPMGHAFENTLLLLDDERRGFDYPLVQFSVNCYGRRDNGASGLRLTLGLKEENRKHIPPLPKLHPLTKDGPAPAPLISVTPV